MYRIFTYIFLLNYPNVGAVNGPCIWVSAGMDPGPSFQPRPGVVITDTRTEIPASYEHDTRQNIKNPLSFKQNNMSLLMLIIEFLANGLHFLINKNRIVDKPSAPNTRTWECLSAISVHLGMDMVNM